MTKRCASIDADEIRGLETVRVSLCLDDVLMTVPAGTAVGTPIALLSHSDVVDAAWLKQVRELIAILAGDGELSQRTFWRFYKDVQGGRQPDVRIMDGHKRLTAIEAKAHRNRVAHGVEQAEAYVSAKDRTKILSALEMLCLSNSGDEVSLAELQEVLATAVAEHIVIRIRFKGTFSASGVPSTQAWVHGFVLWTGISPPVVVKQLFVPLTTDDVLGESRVNFRYCSVRHRRGYLDGRAFRSDGQGRPSHRSSFARRPHPGRREHLCQSQSGWEWPASGGSALSWPALDLTIFV
jgi:hypothetical protein